MKQTINTENFTRQIQINGTVFDVHYFDRNINTYLTEQQVFYAIVQTMIAVLPHWESLCINEKIDMILLASEKVGLHISIGESHEPFMSI